MSGTPIFYEQLELREWREGERSNKTEKRKYQGCNYVFSGRAKNQRHSNYNHNIGKYNFYYLLKSYYVLAIVLDFNLFYL